MPPSPASLHRAPAAVTTRCTLRRLVCDSSHCPEVFYGTAEKLIPVYGTVVEACQAHPNADVFINFASFRRCAALACRSALRSRFGAALSNHRWRRSSSPPSALSPSSPRVRLSSPAQCGSSRARQASPSARLSALLRTLVRTTRSSSVPPPWAASRPVPSRSPTRPAPRTTSSRPSSTARAPLASYLRHALLTTHS